MKSRFFHTPLRPADHGLRRAGWAAAGALLFLGGIEAQAATLASGHAHTCAVASGGDVECWGLNDLGQLGDGTLIDKLIPVPVVGLAETALAVTAGDSHTCALLASGSLACWGDNTDGQLGTGDPMLAQSVTPVAVVGLGGSVVSIVAGLAHNCAALSNGAVQCWGDNGDGQIGDGSVTDRFTPTVVPGLSAPVSAMALGEAHTCVLTSLGLVSCWGDNSAGQLGDGTTASKLFATTVPSLTADVAAIGAGAFHTCALKTTGEALCWGDNFLGQLGTGDFEDRKIPTAVVGLGGSALVIDAGQSFTCAHLVSGGLECWGDNFDGQLGDGTTNDHIDPMPVVGFSGGVGAFALGDSHGCAGIVGAGVECWGDNFYGQLGNGLTVTALAPVAVMSASDVPLLPVSGLGLSVVLALLGGFLSVRRDR